MKKSILNLGKVLNKTQQKAINGGGAIGFCDGNGDCPSGSYCSNHFCHTNGSDPGNGGGNGGGCTTPTRFCLDEHDTCCIYI